jgi:hypothetical protein
MGKESSSGTADDVLSLCEALRQAEGMLGLAFDEKANLLDHVAAAEVAARTAPVDKVRMDAEVRTIRYVLVEVADGPISALMADVAARIVGDGVGRLFS